MTDMAPISSNRVLHTLNRYLFDAVPEQIIDRMEVSTVAREDRHGAYRAVSTVARPKRNTEAQYHEMDRAVAEAFKRLPGFAGSYSVTMGTSYEVEWDGICRPV
jgi:hypothetical protein